MHQEGRVTWIHQAAEGGTMHVYIPHDARPEGGLHVVVLLPWVHQRWKPAARAHAVPKLSQSHSWRQHAGRLLRPGQQQVQWHQLLLHIREAQAGSYPDRSCAARSSAQPHSRSLLDGCTTDRAPQSPQLHHCTHEVMPMTLGWTGLISALGSFQQANPATTSVGRASA